MAGKTTLPAGHYNSMGMVRYYLALAVFVSHFNIFVDNPIWFPTTSYTAVGGFFALSGFLIYPSYLKSRNLKDYLLRRAKRILPSYIFIVLLCAFGLVFMSTLPAKEYFFNPQWVRYLVSNLAMLNFMGSELPGVFQDLPLHTVNGSLWTMKIEVMLYLSVPLVAAVVLKMHRRLRWCGPLCVCVAIYMLSACYRLYFLHLFDVTDKAIYGLLAKQVFGQLMYFYGGVFIYFIYDRFLKYRNAVLAACILIMLVSDYMPYLFYRICILPAVVSCMVIYFSQFRFAGIFNKNNVSYEMYLYHLPVLLVAYSFLGGKGLPEWVFFCIALACTLALSYVSWFLIGRNFMRR